MSMSQAIRQFLIMLATFFSAGEKIAKTLDNLATVAEETSGSYVDEARADRQAKIAARAQAAAETALIIENATKSSATNSKNKQLAAA
jgi:hypothetical protein